MANLNQMKAAAAAQGATAPPDFPGGPDAWVQAWYQNAVNAGSIPGERTRGELTATDATTGATPQGYKNTGTSAFADMIRAKAKAEGWSEDFERYSDAQIEAWKSSWDPQAGRFRSEGGGGALVEKPTECPPGTTLHGSKCVSWEQLPWELGGQAGVPGGGGGGVGGPGGGGEPAFDANDPLQARLLEMFSGREGAFQAATQPGVDLEGGGVWWSPQAGGAGVMEGGAVNPALAQAALTAFTPAAPSQQPRPQAAPPKSSYEAGGFTGGSAAASLMQAQPQAQPMGTSGGFEVGGVPGQQALTQAVQKRFTKPSQWWMEKQGPLEA